MRSLVPWPRRCAAGTQCVVGYVPGRIYWWERVERGLDGLTHEADVLARVRAAFEAAQVLAEAGNRRPAIGQTAQRPRSVSPPRTGVRAQ